MNARIQVEHPVTEMVTGIDLVAEQIAIAAGEGLRIRRSAGVARRAAPSNAASTPKIPPRDFVPSPGRVTHAEWPQAEGVRVDTQVESGSMVPPYYDSLIGKIIVHAPTRPEAVARMHAALAATRIDGVRTNLDFQAACWRRRVPSPAASTRIGWAAS